MSRQNQGRTFFGTNGTPAAINVTFGNTSPTLDALPRPATAGDIRILTDQANPNDLKWVCTVSGTPGTWVLVSAGGGSGGDILVFESINLVGTKLAAFVTTGKPQGTIAYVGNDTFVGQHSVQDFFVLKYGENLSPDGKVVVNSSTFLADGAQWVRMMIFNPANQQRAFWSVDPANSTGLASDENSGWGATMAAADLNPLRTMSELKRRTAGIRYSGTVVFHQLSSAVSGEPLDISTLNGNGYPVWLGKKAQVFPAGAGTTPLTTYAAANPAGNTGVQISIAALPVSFTASGLVGLCIESADGTRCAMIQKDLGSKTARITQPCNPDVVNFATPTAQVFTAGEEVRIVSFPVLPCAPFATSGQGYAGFSDVSLVSADFTDYDFGAWQVLGGRYTTGGSGINFRGNVTSDCCQYASGTVFVADGRFSNRFCGARGANITPILGGFFSIDHAPFDFQASKIQAQVGAFAAYGVESDIGVFDCPANFLGFITGAQLGQSMRFNPTTRLYGTGNVGYLAAVEQGITIVFFAIANCFATTAAAKPLALEGVEYAYADMPVTSTRLGGILTP